MSGEPSMFRFSHEAMATSFEVLIAQEDLEADYAALAAESVFKEIDRLEDELSRFRPGSDIWRLNQLAAGQSLSVSLATWDCLNLAKTVWQETHGAFDITIGPLMHLWRRQENSLSLPDPDQLSQARKSVGSQHFELDEANLLVTVHADHMVFDLGAIGKGYALDQAAEILGEWSINRAFLNAGDSTLLALAPPPGQEAWDITLADGAMALSLRDQALSGSGFQVQGAHLMDPRTLQPLPVQPQRSYALAPSAALSDALSTAFMILSAEETQLLCQSYQGQIRALYV